MSFVAVVERLRILSNPYPGLRPFETFESHLFFGRDQQIAELVVRLERDRFVAVVGASGSGKSSLVRAGLIPTLERGWLLEAGRRWRIVITRPGAVPLQSLADDLSRAGLNPSPLTRSSHGLIDVAQQLSPDESLLVLVDQFEELFRYKDLQEVAAEPARHHARSADNAAEFVQLLLEASRHTRPVFIVITMRSDYLGDCAAFRGLPETLNECLYLVPRMTREQRREANEVPLGRTTMAPGLAQRLLNDAGDEPDQLPVLQHALMRTWTRWRQADPDQRRRIDIEDYEAIGGLHHAIDRHAEEVFASVDHSIAETIFKRLTARGRGDRERRNPATFEELCAICGAMTPDARQRVAGVIDRFRVGDATFLTPREGPLSGAKYIDITHESLIRHWRRLRDAWLPEEQQSAKAFLDLVDRAKRWEEGNGEPLSGLDLTTALEWDRRRNRTSAWAELYALRSDLDRVLRFIQASKAHDRSVRLRRRGLWIAAPLAVLFALLLLVAVTQAVDARNSAMAERGARLTARSQLLQVTEPDLSRSVLLAVEALRLSPGRDAEEALGLALSRVPRQVLAVARTPPHQDAAVRFLSVSADDRSLAIVGMDGTIRVLELPSGREIDVIRSPSKVVDIVPARPGTWIIATAAAGDSARLLTIPGGQEIRRFEGGGEATMIAVSRDARHALVVGDTARVLNLDTGHAVVVSVPGTPIETAISPDGRRVAVGVKVSRSPSRVEHAVYVFEADSGSLVSHLELSEGLQSLALSQGGRVLVAGEIDGTVRLYHLFDLDRRSETRLPRGGRVAAIDISDDATLVATAGTDGTTRVFDTALGAEIARVTHRCGDNQGEARGTEAGTCMALAVAISRDGRQVFSGGSDGAVHAFEAAGAYDLVRIVEDLPVTALAVGQDGRRLVVGSGHIETSVLRVFDAPDWKQIAQLAVPTPEAPRAAALSADGRFLAVASNWFGGPWVYDLDEPNSKPVPLNGPSLMEWVALSDDGSWLTSRASGEGQLFDRISGESIAFPRLPQIRAISVSDDGRFAVAGTTDANGSAVVLFRLPAASEVMRVSVPEPPVFVAVSPDGKWIATSGASQGSIVRLIDAAAQRERWTHTGAPETALAFHPDSSSVAILGSDGAILMFDVPSGRELRRLIPGRRVGALQFAEHGRYLLAASRMTSAWGGQVNVTRYPLRQQDLMEEACSRIVRNLTREEWRDLVGADVPHQQTCDEIRSRRPSPERTSSRQHDSRR